MDLRMEATLLCRVISTLTLIDSEDCEELRRHHECNNACASDRECDKCCPTVDQYYSDPFHGRGSAGQVGTPRHADGTRSTRIHPMESCDAFRSAGPYLA